MPKDQINIRVGKELKMILIQKDNYSEFCRECILRGIEQENNEQFLRNEIDHFKEQIKEREQKLKSQKDGSHKLQAILDFSYTSYKTDWVMLQDDAQCEKIQHHVIPKLREAGCNKYKIADVLKIFRKRYEEEKIDV